MHDKLDDASLCGQTIRIRIETKDAAANNNSISFPNSLTQKLLQNFGPFRFFISLPTFGNIFALFLIIKSGGKWCRNRMCRINSEGKWKRKTELVMRQIIQIVMIMINPKF